MSRRYYRGGKGGGSVVGGIIFLLLLYCFSEFDYEVAKNLFISVLVIGGVVVVIKIASIFTKPYNNPKDWTNGNARERTGEYNTVSFGTANELQMERELRIFEPWGAKFVRNCLLAKDNGEKTEIDMLMITPKGIFVFENKDYNGWVFGNSDDEQWTATYRGGWNRAKKYRFYNPIKQNEGHIKALKKYVGEDIPIYSMIVFGDDCSLKKVTNNSSAQILHTSSIRESVNFIMASQSFCINEERANSLFGLLYSMRMTSYAEKEELIKTVNKYK